MGYGLLHGRGASGAEESSDTVLMGLPGVDLTRRGGILLCYSSSSAWSYFNLDGGISWWHNNLYHELVARILVLFFMI